MTTWCEVHTVYQHVCGTVLSFTQIIHVHTCAHVSSSSFLFFKKTLCIKWVPVLFYILRFNYIVVADAPPPLAAGDSPAANTFLARCAILNSFTSSDRSS